MYSALSPGLTVITVLEKTVAAMPLRKASKAILASDIKSTREVEIGQRQIDHAVVTFSCTHLLFNQV